MDQGYPTESNIDTYLSGKNLELPEEYNANYIAEEKQRVYGLVSALEFALALSVYCASSTTINVRGGKYVWNGEVKTYTPGAAVNPTDNDTTYVWLTAANAIGSGIDGSGWPSAEHIKLAEIVVDSDGVITSVTDLRGQAFLGYRPNAVAASGITTGSISAKVIASAELEALLDTATNNLFAVKAGDVVLAVKLFVQTAAGAACAVTIGTDVDVDGTTADVDALLKAGDANATGVQSSDDVAGTYAGDDLLSGAFVADDDGYITITSSSDQSSSSFVGKIVMLYIPA